MNAKIAISMLAVVAVGLLCGCDPNEINVEVKTSELKKAAEEGLGTAHVTLVYAHHLPAGGVAQKLADAAKPYLGKNAKIEVSEFDDVYECFEGPWKTNRFARLVADFDIPVGTTDALAKVPKSILKLVYTPDEKMFRLSEGDATEELNEALAKIDKYRGFYFFGGAGEGVHRYLFMTNLAEHCHKGRKPDCDGWPEEFVTGAKRGVRIKVVPDVKLTIGMAAVRVAKLGGDDGSKDMTFEDINEKYTCYDFRPILAGNVALEKESICIDYSNDCYCEYEPCFTLGDVTEVKAVKVR